jgi:hypothetical protein
MVKTAATSAAREMKDVESIEVPVRDDCLEMQDAGKCSEGDITNGRDTCVAA